MNEQSEKPLIVFLRSAAAYPHHPVSVRVVETHISWVFIASPFVFKIKKPVNLGFADFSTLDKRHYFCQRELELNRRLCSDVYLDVVPIYEHNERFSFTAEGQVFEYALKMHELSHDCFLSELVARDAVDRMEITRIIARLQNFYAAENPTPEIEASGLPEKLKVSTDENFTNIEPFIGKTISPSAVEAIRHYTDSFYAAHGALFSARIAQGRIRDCHGDLRLDHIHITSDAVRIFDCIEFNDRFRFIDIANDLAFLAMDFDFVARYDLANLFLRNAARVFNDSAMLKLTDFYKCYRAVVRGKVESIQAISQHVQNADEHLRRAQRYFRLALGYATIGSETMLITVMGGIASGKSALARRLAGELGWPVFSSDQIRKTLANLPLNQRTPRELRRAVYSEAMTAQTYANLITEGIDSLRRQGGAVLDATFSKREHRNVLRARCAEANVGLKIIELKADPNEVVRRLQRREQTTTEISDARLEDFGALSAAYEPPSKSENMLRIRSTGDPAQTLLRVLSKLADERVISILESS